MQIFSDELIKLLKKEFKDFRNIKGDLIEEEDVNEIKTILRSSLDVVPRHVKASGAYTDDQKNFMDRQALKIALRRQRIYDQFCEEFGIFKMEKFDLKYGKKYSFFPPEEIQEELISYGEFISYTPDQGFVVFCFTLSDGTKIHRTLDLLGKLGVKDYEEMPKKTRLYLVR